MPTGELLWRRPRVRHWGLLAVSLLSSAWVSGWGWETLAYIFCHGCCFPVLRLRVVGRRGGKTRGSDCSTLTLAVTCTAMTRSTLGLLAGSRRYNIRREVFIRISEYKNMNLSNDPFLGESWFWKYDSIRWFISRRFIRKFFESKNLNTSNYSFISGV